MKSLSSAQFLGIPKRVIINQLKNKPMVVSFEVTLSCVARCRHCDTGGLKDNEEKIPPEAYRKYIQDLQPAFVQLSGGEPLLRDDLPEIVKSIKNGSSMPYIVVVTNGHLLNEQKYIELKKAGADRFSLSLDFPDERHDDFRRLPGLYDHLNVLIPRLASLGYGDIAMNCCITRVNFPYLKEIAYKCEEWGINVSYSAYSTKRINDPQYFISDEKDLETLRNIIDDLITIKQKKGIILNPAPVLRNIYKFFKEGGMPGCSAGRKFLVVRPEGALNPCSMYREKRYKRQKEMIKDFSDKNDCQDCYVAIRAYSDKSLWSLIKEVGEIIKTR
jgi:MoaA/NifB/PqqE/SkfB family radical SAM enzyme